MATRRRPPLKWQPLAPPTPRVLNFPRRHVRRLQQPSTAGASAIKRGTTRLEALFDEERVFGKDGVKLAYDVPVVLLNAGGESLRRERVAEEEEVAGVEAEMLRAECRFLRMERELTLKKVKRNRARMERVLRSALQTLISGRDKVAGESGSVCESLDKEIEAMRCKLVDLQRASRTKLFECHQRSISAFDDQYSESRGFALDENHIPKEIQELAEASFSIHAGSATEDSLHGSSRFTDVEVLSRRMEEVNGSMKLSKVGSSVASSASTSCRIEMPDLASSYSIRQGYYQERMGDDEQPCSERCRAVVRRVTEQVRLETEQWCQLQEMVEKVREEMEQLQASRDMWEREALDSKNQILSLNSTVEEWKKKALSDEAKANGLQTQVQVLQEELKMARDEARTTTSPSLQSAQNSNQKDKRVLICQLKENHNFKNVNNKGYGAARDDKKQLEVPKRSPFRDIGNSSPLMRQIAKVVFPGHRR
ncbi:unnamed protein product [Rhodiola kirilowii]